MNYSYRGDIVADDIAAFLLKDMYLLGFHKRLTGGSTDRLELDIAEPVAEKECGVAAVIDKHRTVGGAVLRLNDEHQLTIFTLKNTIHK